MSDLLQFDNKVKQGAEWRGTTEVSMDDSIMGSTEEDSDAESFGVTYRLLKDPEFAESIARMGADNFEDKLASLEDARSAFDDDQLERYEELERSDDLSDDEREELEALQNELEDESNLADVLGMMDPDLTDGFHYAAECGLEPDEDDIQEVLNMKVPEQREMFGEHVPDREKAVELLQQRIEENIIGNSTGFTAYGLGMEIFMESMEDQGN